MRAVVLLGAVGLSACASAPTTPPGPVSYVPGAAVPGAPAKPGSPVSGDIVLKDKPWNPPPGMQYLYGSGEAGAVSIQAFRGLIQYAEARAKKRPVDSVVLAEGSSLDAPRFVSCGKKPLAAVFDVDETVILNLGAEYADAKDGKPFDPARWDRWERTGVDKVAPVPGAVTAMNALRKAGITVIFNTNRAAANAAQTVAAIEAAGLGKAVHGETLFLKGDDASGSKKDARRATISARWCVIALGGDQLGDFSDAFNAGMDVPARRQAAIRGPLAALWGNGWFALPNPVYGSGLAGDMDQVFPVDKQWQDPAPAEKK